MARHAGPRADSAAHKVMCRLVELGGTAGRSALILHLGADFNRPKFFNSTVVHPLEQFGFVIADQYSLAATPAGKNYVADFMERTSSLPPEKYVGKIATPRMPPPIRPFNFSKHFDMSPRRAGALDHRGIPSLMGGQRVLPGQGVIANDD